MTIQRYPILFFTLFTTACQISNLDPLPKDQWLDDIFIRLEDRFIAPEFELDALTEPENNINLCTNYMIEKLDEKLNQYCMSYTDEQKMTPGSPFYSERHVAACLLLSCEGRQIDGHNGLMIAKNCPDVGDLKENIKSFVSEAKMGQCINPVLSMRVIDIASFMGGEPCNQLRCETSVDGTTIKEENP
ncbi:hypothetical protein M1146_05740 [Patescibacteria group bacterium]|nr:hypothetical protein [Patescibacteria group bacterium]